MGDGQFEPLHKAHSIEQVVLQVIFHKEMPEKLCQGGAFLLYEEALPVKR